MKGILISMLYKTLKIEQLKPHNKSRGAGLNSS